MKSFEQHLKQSLENYEDMYSHADWNDLENRLNKVNSIQNTKNVIAKTLMIAASVIVVAGIVYYFINNNSENTETIIPKTTIKTLVNENPIQQVVSDNQQQIINHQPSVSNTNSQKEKVLVNNNVTEDKLVSSDKTESQVSINENKPEEQPQNSDIKSPSLNPHFPNASFNCNKNTVCTGDPVLFTSDNTNVPCSFRWDFGDSKYSIEKNPKHIYKEAGTYTVKLRTTSLADKKSDEQSMKDMITVHPVPVLEINWNASSDESNHAINFEARGEDVVEWKWDFGDKSRMLVTEQNPTHIYNKKGNYTVSVMAKNGFNCTSIYKKDVNVEYEYNLLAPTGFSPNGDGLNDTWIPVALLEGNKVFTITIFDKTGNIIYKISDKNHPWDGQNVKTGDTFFWRAVVKDKNSEEANYEGYIIISNNQ
ncbi:MAG: PKD domain-containing protein [Bacteroidota bacterium]